MAIMRLVGYAGFEEEGERVYLYQCVSCKRVEYDHDTMQKQCGECKDKDNHSFGYDAVDLGTIPIYKGSRFRARRNMEEI